MRLKHKILLLFLLLISIQICSQDLDDSVDTFLAEHVDYYYELVKFYIKEAEYDLALNYLDSIMTEPADSLYYFKGLALQGKNEWQLAADNFAWSMIYSENETLLDTAAVFLQKMLAKLPSMCAIEALSRYVTMVESDDVLIKFLLLIAEIYENNQLFAEANDVYKTILKETDYQRQIPMQMKIAMNYLQLEEFNDALNTLSPIVALNDSIYNEDALFLYYLANYALDRLDIAQKILLRLYYDYPDHANRTEILSGLADVFEQQNQLILCWFFLNELFNSTSDAQKYFVQKDIEKIILKIGKDKPFFDQFKYLKLIWDDEFSNSEDQDD